MTVNSTSQRAQTGRPTSGPMRGGPSFGLEDVARLREGEPEFPTPNVPNGTQGIPCDAVLEGRTMRTASGRKVQVTLQSAVRIQEGRMFPTPTAMNPNDGEDLVKWGARRERERAKHRNGNGFGMPLAIAARVYPTPNASAACQGESQPDGKRGQTLIGAAGGQQWPTPKAEERGQRNSRDSYRALSAAVKDPGSPLSAKRRRGKRIEDVSFLDAQEAPTSEIFPTPTSSMVSGADMEQARFAGNGGMRPSYEEAKAWPTPAAADAMRRGADHTRESRPGAGGGDDLQTAVLKEEFPTPSASPWRSGRASEETMGRNSRPLSEVVWWRSPIREVSCESEPGGQLAPLFVQWLMGWPLGWTSLEPLPTEACGEWLEKTLGGEWWLVEPPVPRLIRGEPSRVDQIRALGNGQVPLCAAVAWTLLSEELR